MGKNKNKPNQYSEFINSQRPVLEARYGRKLTFDEISEIVSDKWQVGRIPDIQK